MIPWYLGLMILIFGMMFGSWLEARDWRQKLVKRGLAIWYPDQDGKPKWTWKEDH